MPLVAEPPKELEVAKRRVKALSGHLRRVRADKKIVGTIDFMKKCDGLSGRAFGIIGVK